MPRWVLLKRDKEFDIFTDGTTIYAGVLEKGKPVYGYEIGELDLDLDSKTENYIRKKVAKYRKIKKRKVIYYLFPTTKIFEAVGYVWDSGSLFLVDYEGLIRYENDCYIYNKKSKVLVDKLNKLIREWYKIKREIYKVEEKLEKYHINFKKHFLGDKE